MIACVQKLVIGVALFAVSLATLAADALVLRTAETQPAGYPTAQALTFMAARLDEWSQGKLQMKLYPGGQLGDERDTLELTIFGGIDLNRVNLAPSIRLHLRRSSSPCRSCFALQRICALWQMVPLATRCSLRSNHTD